MHESMVPIAQTLAVGATLFERALDGLADDELRRQPSPDVNPIGWVAGHVATHRCVMLSLAGVPCAPAWGQRFFRGAERGDLTTLPAVDELLRAWRAVSPQLAGRLGELTEDALLAPSGRTLPPGDSTVRGALAFLAWHEGWHLGQMAYLRKWLGRPGLVG